MNVILGGKNCISLIELDRLPTILNPHQIPAMKVTADTNTSATINTSTRCANHAGKPLMNATIYSNIMPPQVLM